MWLHEGQFGVLLWRREETCVCLCEFKRWKAGRMDMVVRMRPLTVMCPYLSGTNMWHSSAGLLHVLKGRMSEGEREWERGPPTMPIEYCEAAAGGTCSDLKTIYSGQDGVPLTALLFISGRGWMVSVYSCKVLQHSSLIMKRKEYPVHIWPNQSKFNRGTAENQQRWSDVNVWWKNFLEIKWRCQTKAFVFWGVLRWGSATRWRRG